MIKLQDFARQQGVTDRAIQKHLKTYAVELEGLYQRKGPNGTWLSDEACEILRSKMKQAPLVVSETSDVVKSLEEENKQLLQALNAAKDKIIELTEQNGQLALKAEKTEMLEADNAAKEKEKDILEGFIKDAKKEIGVLNDEKAEISRDKEELKQKVAEAEKTAEKANMELSVLVNGSWRERRQLRKKLKQQGRELKE